MATLYELTGEYQALMDMVEDEDVDPGVLSDTLEAIGGEIEDKADGYAMMIRNLQVESDGIKDEIDRLQHRKDVLDHNVDRMKKALGDAMIATNRRKFKTQLFSFGIQENPASVKVDDEKAIPAEFWKQPDPVLNKASLRDALKKGTDVPGAHLEQSEGLRIK